MDCHLVAVGELVCLHDLRAIPAASSISLADSIMPCRSEGRKQSKGQSLALQVGGLA